MQHHAVLHTTLTVHPPSSGRTATSLCIRANLIQGSFFTILPKDRNYPLEPQWYLGNVYNLERALHRTIHFPSPPSLTYPTTYDVFVSSDYEIRLSGDPTVHGTESPVQELQLSFDIDECSVADLLVHESSQDMICDFIQGYSFGNFIGIGIRSVTGRWTVADAVIEDTDALSICLRSTVTLAPSQTRVIGLLLSQSMPFDQPRICVRISAVSIDGLSDNASLSIHLPIKHLKLWSPSSYDAITATHFGSLSSPTTFLAVPPFHDSTDEPRNPILAIHGSGIDIFRHKFWVDAIPRRKNSWIIIPTGGSSWGLDWHGPSARDAYSSVPSLSSILDNREQWRSWSFRPDSPVLIIGHSNGGQGAIYLASRYPDRAIGVVAAAGYIKSQAYVPLTMSRSAHYIDPFLRAILESSFTPDDNDLHLTNITDKPVFLIHGGDDENVPVWHSREIASILRTLQANHKDIIFREDVGQSHWYPTVFDNEEVQDFMTKSMTPQNSKPSEFIVTVSCPEECGSLYGWKIKKVVMLGRLARLHIAKRGASVVKVSASNVLAFSVDRSVYECTEVHVGDSVISLSSEVGNPVSFQVINRRYWEVTRTNGEEMPAPSRLQAILVSPGPLLCIVPDASIHREVSLALRLAHDCLLYHRLDTEILLESDALRLMEEDHLPCGNIIYFGYPSSIFASKILGKKETGFEVEDSMLVFALQKIMFNS